LTCPTSTLIIKTVMNNNPWYIKNTRDKAYELIEEGVVSYQQMAEACLQYMSTDDIEDMLISNEMIDVEEELDCEGSCRN
jgi:hypothetical protein